LHNVAKEDFLYRLRVNFGFLEGALEGKDAEFGCGEGLEGAIEGADGGTCSGDNDNFVRAVIRLCGTSGNCDRGVWVSVPLSG